MTKTHKAAILSGRKIHLNVDGVLKCGEERRQGLRMSETIKDVTCEACLKGKNKGKVGRPKGSKNKPKDDENDDDIENEPKALISGGHSITFHGLNKADIKRLLQAV